MKQEREQEIRSMVRKQLLEHLEDAKAGSETLMKEVWERILGAVEGAIVRDEVHAIIKLIQWRDSPPARGAG